MAKRMITNRIVDNELPVLKATKQRDRNVIGSGEVKVDRDKSIIQNFESAQDYDWKQRDRDFWNAQEDSTAKERYDAYNERQAMVNEYNAAKERQISQALDAYTGNADLATLAGGNANRLFDGKNYKQAQQDILPYLQQNGITLDQLTNYYGTQAMRDQNRQMADYAEEHPVLGTLASFPIKQIGNFNTAADALSSYIQGKPMGTNTAVNEYGKLTPTIRGTIKENIKDNANTDFGGSVGTGAYDVVTGIGDQLMSLALTGGSKAGTLGLMSANSGADVLAQNIDKDTTADQKIATALAGGAIEALTEKLPLDNLFRLANNNGTQKAALEVFKGIAKQMFSESGEEFVSEIANTMMDNFINGSQSDYQQNVANYVARGMDQNQASQQAMKDVAQNALYAGLIGGISGGVMGGGASLIGNMRYNQNPLSPDRFAPEINENYLEYLDKQKGRDPQGGDAFRMIPALDTANYDPSVVNRLMLNNEVGLNEALQGYDANANMMQSNIPWINQDEPLLPFLRMAEQGKTQNADYGLLAQLGNNNQGWTQQGEYLGNTYDRSALDQMVNRYAERNVDSEWGGESEFAPESNPIVNPVLNQIKNFMGQYYQTGDAKYLGAAESIALANRIGSNEIKQALANDINTESEWGNDIFDNQQTEQNTAPTTSTIETAAPTTEVQQPVVEEKKQTKSKKKKSAVVDDGWARFIADLEREEQSNQSLPNIKKQDTNKQQTIPTISQNVQNIAPHSVPSVTESATNNTPGKTVPSITSRNSYQNSPQFSSEEAQKWLARERAKGTFDVDVVTEGESYAKAVSRLLENPEAEINRIENDKTLDGFQVDEAMILMDQKIAQAEKTGDWSEVRRFSSMVNQKIHKVAQGLQALAKYTRSAESAIMKTEQIIRTLTGEDANISDADYSEVNRLFKEAEKLGESSKARMETEQQAYKILAKYLPDTTFMDKWNAWRYLAMLGNTRTHIRNVLGNFMFGTVTNIKDAIAGTLESAFAKEGNRTKSFMNMASPELLNAAKADADVVWQDLTDSGTNKYSMRNEIENERAVFDNKWLEAIRQFNNKMLTKEDNFALVNKYKRALAGYLAANGYDASIFKSTNEADQKFLKEARKYAIHEAKVATFHEESQAADWLNRASRDALAKDSSLGKKAGGLLIETLFPFKKTPVNILKQGAVAYNPLQVVHGLFDAIADGKNPTKAIDELARGLTGSGIMALGYWLASLGLLKPSQKDDDDLDKLTGEQGYSINVGNKSYTIDWAAPAALPLFVGAELSRTYENRDDFDFWSAMSSISDPMVEMSMLQGLKNNIESLASFTSGKNTFGDAIINSGFGYASQGVPTLGGQVARSVDDTRRSTYTGQQGTADTVMRNVKKIQNKIPGLSMLNEPYVDAWGQTQENTGGNLLGRMAYNMLSPGYYSDTSKDSTEQELYRLTDKMKSGEIENKSIIPSVAGKTYNKERLSPSDYTKISTEKGQITRDLYEKAMANPNYADMPDADKADLLNNLQKFGNALSKSEVFDYDMADSDTYKKKYEAYEYKGADGLVDYYAISNKIKDNYKADSRTNPNKADRINALDSMDLSQEDKIAYLKILDDYTKRGQYVEQFLGEKYAYDWYRVEALSGSKKDEKIYTIYTMDIPDWEKQLLMEVLNMKDDEITYHVITGQ